MSTSGQGPSTAESQFGAITLRDDDPRVRFSLEQGEVVGRYLILSELGRGGMGVVYAAYDPELDRKVALKFLSAPGRRTDSSIGRTRLLREAQAMARLSHPNVITVHDVGAHQDFVFVAMEYIDGLTLKQWLDKEARNWGEVLDVLGRAGEGLVAAHEAGLLHRDFKPDNVMIRADGRVQVMDFGLARSDAAHSESAELAMGSGSVSSGDVFGSEITRAGSTLGTPAYMAPEQLMSLNTDARTDQFNFCVTLYESLYGERPFAGTSMSELMAHVTRGEFRPVPASRGVPNWLRKVVVRGLSVDPKERFDSMAKLLMALRADPTRSRRRIALGVGALAIVGAGFGVHTWQESRAVAECHEQGASIAEIWDDSTRARVESALLASELPYADSTWRRIEGWLDRYAAQWSSAATEACLATNVERSRTPALHDRTTSCLDERRRSLGSLVGILERPDDSVIQSAVRAAASLPPIAPCTDDIYLADRLPPPEDPGLRARVEGARERVEEGHVLLGLGRFDDAAEAARDALAHDAAEEYEPLAAEAHLLLGAAASKQAKFDEAESELERAFLIAGAVAHDEVGVAAAADLAYVTGYALNRHVEGLRWAELGEMAARRTRGDGRLQRARILSARGVVHDAQGDYEHSMPEHEEALRLRIEALGEDHPDVALSANNLGTVLHAKGDYQGALARFQHGLDVRRRALGPEHPDVAVSLNNAGAVHYSTGDYDAAIALFEESLAIAERALGPKHPDVGRTLHNLAGLVKRKGEYERSLEMYERALEIWTQQLGAEHPNVAATLDDIGLLEQTLERYEDAAQRHRRALEIWEKAVGPEHPDVATCLMSLARAQLGRGELNESVQLYERSRAVLVNAHGEHHPEVAAALTGLGHVHSKANRHREAASAFTRAVTILKAAKMEPAATADARFGLARAKWESGADRSAALVLADEARADLAAAGDAYASELQEVVSWLDTRAK